MTDIELQQLKKQDLKDFRILSKLISNKKYWAARTKFWDMDTAARDQYINLKTNNRHKNVKKYEDILHVDITRR